MANLNTSIKKCKSCLLGNLLSSNPYVDRIRGLGSNVQYSTYTNGNVGTTTLVDGTLTLVSIYIDKKSTINGIGFISQTQGVYTADNYNGVGLYKYDSTLQKMTLIASSVNNGNLWKGLNNTYIQTNFSQSITIDVGVYYIAQLYNSSAASTAPALTAVSTFISNPSIMLTMALPINAKLACSIPSQNALPLEILDTATNMSANGTIYNLY